MSGGYGYGVRGYNNAYSGGLAVPVTEKWKKFEYAESDHVGREQPYVPSTESYVVKTERIIEKVHNPTVIEYSRVSPVKYGVERNRWGTTVPSSVDDRPRKVEEFITQVQTEVSQPQLLRPPPRLSPDYKHGHGSYPSSEYRQQESTDAWSRSSSPAGEYKHSPKSSEYGGQNNNTWGSRPFSQVHDTDRTRSPVRPGYLGNMSRVPEPVHPLPAPVADNRRSSISPVRNETRENNPWIRNSRPGFLGSTNWRQTPTSTYSTTQSPQTGYDSYNDFKGKELDKDRSRGYSHNYHDNMPKDYASEQFKYISAEPSPQLARREWPRPGPGNWATTATKVTTLTRPTNDINEAVNYLAGALQQTSFTQASPQKHNYNTLGGPKMEHYADTIDSREAQSRYGNMNGSSMARENYTTTIDSREALRRYGGAAV